MKTTITTAEAAVHDRSRHWHSAIAETYFPLDLQFRHTDRFTGDLTSWQLGSVSLSRLTSDALLYRRLPHHFRRENEEHFLVTIPVKTEVHFQQCGTEVRCRPGGFILERSHEPYEFSHAEAADLWVMKVEAKALGGRIHHPDRFCSMQFSATNGVGGLFTDMLDLIPGRFGTMTGDALAAVGQQLIDLLVLAVKADERTLTMGNSSVRDAHLTRIEQFVRKHLGDSSLDPETIARGCRISTRYLHELFKDTDTTLGNWIRARRLDAARDALAHPANRQTIAEIAYRFGFGDQAQFSRAFRAHVGVPPRHYREKARTTRAIPG